MSGAVRVATGTDSVNSSAAETTGATVSPTTGVKPEQEKNFLQGVSNLAGQIGQFFGGGPPFPNELRDFASYNYIFTFGCLNNFEINFPDNFPKATRDAVNVIAPINDPKNNSTLCVVEYVFVKL